MPDLMTSDFVNGRDRTLQNNLSWLKLFGCTIREKLGLLHVTHPDLAYYNAWLAYPGPMEARERIAALLSDSELSGQVRDLYVDCLWHTRALGEWLVGQGFEVAGSTTTMSSVWAGVERASDWRVVPCDDIEKWSAVYSTGFGLSAREAAIEDQRWAKAAAETSGLRFWFLRKEEITGVCQTHTGSGVTGLFSLTLLAAARGRSDLKTIGRSVFSSAGVPASSVVYYERARPSKRCRTRFRPPRGGRFAPLRSMIWYRR